MRFSELEGKTVGVWGVGAEISAFARELKARLPSARLAAVALDDSADAPGAAELPGAPSTIVTGPAIVPALSECDVVVRSPGVSIYRDELVAVRHRGVPVTTATGLWMAGRIGTPTIGITGTKGKSTTASLIAHLAGNAGETVHLAGNIGRPAIELLDVDDAELAVIELSSYQIADLTAGPKVALVLNLFKEHTDWHLSEAAYRADKLRLLALPGVEACVLNARDDAIAAAPCIGTSRFRFGTQSGWHVADDGVRSGAELVVPTSSLPLPGAHNALNLCAALAALEAAGLGVPDPPRALADFRPLRHRLEVVHERDRVVWIDDSISTTPESTIAAVAAYPDRPIVLLGGGQDRGQDYTILADALSRRDAFVIGLPTTGTRLISAARAVGVAALFAGDLQAAVAAAAAHARPETVVLLSPAAPSYDYYRNYQDRGDAFAALARSA